MEWCTIVVSFGVLLRRLLVLIHWLLLRWHNLNLVHLAKLGSRHVRCGHLITMFILHAFSFFTISQMVSILHLYSLDGLVLSLLFLSCNYFLLSC